jgi:hypothetical protein
MSEKRKSAYKIMEDFDEDAIGDAFCLSQGCSECQGSDYNGEPNGYGCEGRDNFVSKRFREILNQRTSPIKQIRTSR